jgi:hypothetical protein
VKFFSLVASSFPLTHIPSRHISHPSDRHTHVKTLQDDARRWKRAWIGCREGAPTKVSELIYIFPIPYLTHPPTPPHPSPIPSMMRITAHATTQPDERRGMLEHHQHVRQQASNLSMPTVASPLPIRRSSSHTRNVPVTHSQSSDRSVQRPDTVIVTTTSTAASESVLEAPTSYPAPNLHTFRKVRLLLFPLFSTNSLPF